MQIKNNLEIDSFNKNVKLTTFNAALEISRAAIEYLFKINLKTNLRIMIKCITSLIVIVTIFSFTSPVVGKQDNPNLIIGKWVWKESTHVDNNSFSSNPKTIGYTKKIAFTSDGNIITYKNNIELRVSKYELRRGISVFDHKEHDFIIFEGITYVVEKLDNKNLTIANNDIDGYRTKFSR